MLGWYGFWSEPADTTCSHFRFGAESTMGQYTIAASLNRVLIVPSQMSRE